MRFWREIKNLDYTTTTGWGDYEGTTVEITGGSGRDLLYVVVDSENEKFIWFMEDLEGEFVAFDDFFPLIKRAVEYVRWFPQDELTSEELPAGELIATRKDDAGVRYRVLSWISRLLGPAERVPSLTKAIEFAPLLRNLDLQIVGTKAVVVAEDGRDLFSVEMFNRPVLKFRANLKDVRVSGGRFIDVLEGAAAALGFSYPDWESK